MKETPESLKDRQLFFSGFTNVIHYVKHLGTCLLCLNDRGHTCKERERLLNVCGVSFKRMANSEDSEKFLLDTLGTLAGLEFKKEIQIQILERFERATPTEPELA